MSTFDLMSRALVFIPVKWSGTTANDEGEAVPIEHEVSLQVELLDSNEMDDWSTAARFDQFAEERASLTDRLDAAIAASRRGDEGAALLIHAVSEEQTELTAKTKAANRVKELVTFKTVVKGWRKVVSQGRPVPFEDQHIDRLLSWPGFPEAFALAYRDAINGKTKVREGNSEGSPANGPAVEPTAATPKAMTS